MLSIMYVYCTTVGVSHLTVPDDLAGAMAILDWLAFVPKVSKACLLSCNCNVKQQNSLCTCVA